MAGSGNCSWGASRKIRESSLFGLLKTFWKASEQLKALSEKADRRSASGTLPPGLDTCCRQRVVGNGKGWSTRAKLLAGASESGLELCSAKWHPSGVLEESHWAGRAIPWGWVNPAHKNLSPNCCWGGSSFKRVVSGYLGGLNRRVQLFPAAHTQHFIPLPFSPSHNRKD